MSSFVCQSRSGGFAVTSIPGFFYRTVGPVGGHIRLFGLIVYKYNISDSFGYSNTYCWIVPGIVAVCLNDTRNGTLHHCQRPGWHVRWFRFRVKKIASGFEVTLRGPDAYVS